jgi:hypothetical protein
MSSSINNELYKIKRKYCSTGERNGAQNEADERASSRSSSSSNASHQANSNKFHVTKIQERIKFTQKYRIKWACDPNSGLTYSLHEIRKLNLIERESSRFRLPSTGESIDLDQAIRAGIVYAELIDEFLETFNQAFEFIQTDEPPPVLNTKVKKPPFNKNKISLHFHTRHIYMGLLFILFFWIFKV